MFTLGDVASLTAAVGGLLAGAGGIIAAVRQRQPSLRTTPRARLPSADNAAKSVRCSVGFGLLAWLVAAAAVGLSGTRTLAPNRTLMLVLQYGLAVPFALAVYFGVQGAYTAFAGRSSARLLGSAAGLMAAASALLATALVAGVPSR